MSTQKKNNPSMRDRLRPLELISISAVLAVFAGLVVLMATRDWNLTFIASGGGFIVVLMMLALLGLGMKPNAQDLEARKDLKED